MELAPRLRRLGDSSLVNTYLIEGDGGLTVIDAGLQGHWKDLMAEGPMYGHSFADPDGHVWEVLHMDLSA